MIISKGNFLKECLFLDIGIKTDDTGKDLICTLGAVFKNEKISIDVNQQVSKKQISKFNTFTDQSRYIIGHDILRKKSLLPRLRRRVSGLKISTRPVIDTLFLNPLAFPEYPYNPLVRNDCLVISRFKDPVDNAFLARKLFYQQWDRLILKNNNATLAVYRSLLHKDIKLRSTAEALGFMGAQLLDDDKLYHCLYNLACSDVCPFQLEILIEKLQKGKVENPPMAYVLAWLFVAGGESILPSWLGNFFGALSAYLAILRVRPCFNEQCQFCSNKTPHSFLTFYFNHLDFRPKPVSSSTGKSLQGEIVAAAANGKTLLAILPTGGGKSLCFQLPALMAYKKLNQLTIVISPLQALMIDQVSNLSEQIGADISASLHGMLTMPERGIVLEGVRSGATGILYISPEQLRNFTLQKALAERQIKAWVFDEAHCLSKWGHDFRPDYIFSIRFIREFTIKTKTESPAIQCFTATAKKSVVHEITSIIEEELAPKKVDIFAGGHKRDNLHFSAFHVAESTKEQTILDILEDRKGVQGSCIIYCSTHDKVEDLTEVLASEGFSIVAYHAGLPAPLKKKIQQDFLTGKVQIICSTNAFGMGIDKDNVRLVINVGTPSSLENYNQEAGRAGRDGEKAECILIFSDEDLEEQFSMSAMNNLTEHEIVNILRLIRQASDSQGGNTVVISPVELLRLDNDTLDTKRLSDSETKVYTAISWLERAGCLQRNENKTQVLQVKPLVASNKEVIKKANQLDIPSWQRRRWMVIMDELLAKGATTGITVDDIARHSDFASELPVESEKGFATGRVLQTLNDMTKHGLLAHSTNLAASFSSWSVVNTDTRLRDLIAQENTFIQILQKLSSERSFTVDLRQISDQMFELGHDDVTPRWLRMSLYALVHDGKGFAGATGSISIESIGHNLIILNLLRKWKDIVHITTIRQRGSVVAYGIIHRIVKDSAETAKPNLQARFTLEEIDAGLRNDQTLKSLMKNSLMAAERALIYLNQQKMINLEHGLAIFHKSMLLEWSTKNKNKEYTSEDYKPLADFYQEKYFMVHAMNEYAIRATKSSDEASELMESYFNDSNDDFGQKYFVGREKYLQFGTSISLYRHIVDNLKNKIQEDIVSSPVNENMLVLSGPGAGKTRVLVHRIAFLLKALRVKGKSIIVLTFTRSAALDIRHKLRDLVDKEMYGVQVYTFHGFALRLLGKSILVAGANTVNGVINVKEYISQANALLKMSGDEVLGYGSRSPRDVLVGSASHIFVDEYQDIDAEQYELVELVAGKHLPAKKQQMSIMAVGDDDQNIYSFRATNIEFIRRFKDDYHATVYYMVENYRSTANIISASNQLIALNKDRMKTQHPVCVNQKRAMHLHGGLWQGLDLISQGKVQLFKCSTKLEQAQQLVAEIKRLQKLSVNFSVHKCAILARNWSDLSLVRSLCKVTEGMPICLDWGGSSFPSLTRTREAVVLFDYLKQKNNYKITISALIKKMNKSTKLSGHDNVWKANIRALLGLLRNEVDDAFQSAYHIANYLYEALDRQQNRGSLQNGIFLSTVHSTKGLQFDHVFVLGDNWYKKYGDKMEEERRLFYVAMSRAQQGLHLFDLQESHNAHLKNLGGDCFRVRECKSSLEQISFSELHYYMLGMKDIYLDYAGIKVKSNPIHAALANLHIGDTLTAKLQGRYLILCNLQGLPIASLAKNATEEWLPRVDKIKEIKIVAIVQRYKSDVVNTTFRKSIKIQSWEVPIVEVEVCA